MEVYMIAFLQKVPSKKVNRILLVAGLVIFIPLYYLNYVLVTGIMDVSTLTTLLTSFDTRVFSGIITSIAQQGQLDTLFRVYLLNIGSIIGFTCILFSVTVMIARATLPGSRLHKAAFLFPPGAVLIGLLDILSSLVFLWLSRDPGIISDLTTYFTNGAYVARILLLYMELLWILVMGVYLVARAIRKRLKSL